jgi:hypothetical protein
VSPVEALPVYHSWPFCMPGTLVPQSDIWDPDPAHLAIMSASVVQRNPQDAQSDEQVFACSAARDHGSSVSQ